MGSLELLLSTASRRPNADPKDEEVKAAAIREITLNCHTHAALVEARAWSDPAWRRIIDENVSSAIPSQFFDRQSNPETFTREHYLSLCQVFMIMYPDYRAEVITVTVTLDEPEDSEAGAVDEATSCILFRCWGMGMGLEREGIGWMRWRKGAEGQGWRAYTHVNWMGPGGVE